MNILKRNSIIPFILILSLAVLSACQTVSAASDEKEQLDIPPVEPVTDNSQPSPDINNTEPDDIETNIEYDLDYYTEFLRDRINNRFIRFEYGSKDDLNLSLVFYEGFLLKAPWGEHYYSNNVNEYERTALLKLLDLNAGNEETGDITRLYVPEAIEFLYYMTGYEFSREELDAALNNNGYQWTYLEDWDAYYSICSDTEYRFVTCNEVLGQDNSQKAIYYTDEAGTRAVLIVEETEGHTVFVSNRYL